MKRTKKNTDHRISNRINTFFVTLWSGGSIDVRKCPIPFADVNSVSLSQKLSACVEKEGKRSSGKFASLDIFLAPKGFTLIEILLVVIILGILVAMIAPSLFGRGEQARISAARADIEANLSTALDLYELDNGYYPSTEQGLKALNEQPTSSPVPANWSGPYLKRKKEPLDPWKREYRYLYPGIHNTQEYDLFSLGPDGTESPDDVVNWDK